jgi:hypothetical protein
MCCIINFGCGTYMSCTFPMQLQWKLENVCPLRASAYPHVTTQEPLDNYDTWNPTQDSLTNVIFVRVSVFVGTEQHWHFTWRPACVFTCISSVIYLIFIGVKNIVNWSWHKLNKLIMLSTFTVSKIADVSRHNRIISCVLISFPLLIISTC